MSLPFDGAITDFFETGAPDDVRAKIKDAQKGDILTPTYPHSARMKRKAYEAEMAALQIELVKMQAWASETGGRVACVFEGRDAAGKGGTIKRFREHLNPRGAHVVALSKPSETEASEWYFQRYIRQLPSGGEITFFDRSWYNRAIVEPVNDFCSDEEYKVFVSQVNGFENMVIESGAHLVKMYFSITKQEQAKRFREIVKSPLKRWKMTEVDKKAQKLWDKSTTYKDQMFEATNTATAPWSIIEANDKTDARLAALRHILDVIPYELLEGQLP